MKIHERHRKKMLVHYFFFFFFFIRRQKALFNPCKLILRKGDKQSIGISPMLWSVETDAYASVDPVLLPENGPRDGMCRSVSTNVQKFSVFWGLRMTSEELLGKENIDKHVLKVWF